MLHQSANQPFETNEHNNNPIIDQCRPGFYFVSWNPNPKWFRLLRTFHLSNCLVDLVFEWSDPYRRLKRFIGLMIRQPSEDAWQTRLLHVAVRVNGNKSIKIPKSKHENNTWGPIEFKGDKCPTSVELLLDFGTQHSPAEKNVLKVLSNLRHSETSHDIKFVVDKQQFGANVYWLGAVSPVFFSMFHHNFRESTYRTIFIEDAEADVFFQFLNFIYGINPSFEDGMAESLLILADKYFVDPLKLQCIEILFKILSTENAIRILVLADRLSISDLYKTTENYMVENWGPEQFYLHPDKGFLASYCPDLNLKLNKRMEQFFTVTNL